MKTNRILVTALLLMSAGWFVPAGQCDPVDTTSRDEASLARPTSAKLAIWTDQLGYLRWHDRINVYLAMDPMGDRQLYHEFIYLENIETGERTYLVRDGSAPRLRDEIVDVRGEPPRWLGGERVRYLPPTRIWAGRALVAGYWQFVAELRSPDTTEVVKKAHAKFVVSATVPEVIGADGGDTEISTDTTWTNDKIYAIRSQVFVNAGATLAIEPGTLIRGRGPRAVIVVEQGGRILARGRPDAPIVMTCDEPVGQRFEGCWGGLVVLGNAPMTRGSGRALGVAPDTRSVYGGDDALDSSGVLQYLRVEFAGAGSGFGTGPGGLALYGVGAGTLIDHVQAHASAGDGILFSGGTANCTYCVSSGARDDALAWARGWQGTAQHVFLQQSPAGGDCGIEGENDELGFDRLPRSAPKLYNLTLLGGALQGLEGTSHRGGILLHRGSAVTVRNVIVIGFPREAIDVRDNSASLFSDGTSTIGNAIIHANAGRAGHAQINGGVEASVAFRDVEPMLVDSDYQYSPDPRPRLDSPALRVGAGAVPPSDGMLDTGAQYIGAFDDSNWLEEWTFFGDESDYVPPE